MRTYIHTFIVFFFIALTFSANAQKDKDHFVVVLDAGHGGKDPGNLGNGYKEKDIALKIALEVGKELEKNSQIKVIYTRKTDVFIELRERAAIANRADADLFVSIHCNAHSSSAHGTETFVLGAANTQRNFDIAKKENEVIFLESNYDQHYEGFDPNSPESTIGLGVLQEVYTDNSIRLAKLVEDKFSQNLKRKSRGIKQASLWVMHNTYMPSVLIELGFLTYKPEGQFLNSAAGQHKMAHAIKDAVLDYKKELDLNVGDRFFENTPDPTEAVPPVALAQVYTNVNFKVQIAASTRKIETKAYNFKGLHEISRAKDGKLYKYYYGHASDYEKIKHFHTQAKAKGYSSSFIVAFKDGKQVSLSEVLKK